MKFIDDTLMAIRDLWSVINSIRGEYDEVSQELWDEGTQRQWKLNPKEW